MISLEEARRYVLDRVEAGRPIATPVDSARQLVLASDIVARENVPPFKILAAKG